MMTEAELAQLFHDLLDTMTAIRLRTQLALAHPDCQPSQSDQLEAILETLIPISPRLQDAYTTYLESSPPNTRLRARDS